MNKKSRHAKRDLIGAPLPEHAKNKSFIEDFTNYLKMKKISTSTSNTSTMSRSLSHLFSQPDSFLYYETEKDSEFNLESLRNFNSPLFVNLKYPAEWVFTTCGQDGNKGITRLKCHANLREFLEYEVDKYSTDQEFSAMKNAVRQNLDAISLQITKNRLFRKYQIKSNHLKQKMDKAKMILKPSQVVKIENCVREAPKKALSSLEFLKMYHVILNLTYHLNLKKIQTSLGFL